MYNIFVGSLPDGTTDADLKAAFSAIGPVHSASIGRDRHSGTFRGFGFVNFATEEALTLALSAQHRETVMIRGKAVKSYPSDTKNTLYVGNLPRYWKVDQVKAEIEKLCDPVKVEHIALKIGFCFIELINYKAAEKCMQRLKRALFDGKMLNCQMAQARDQGAARSGNAPGAGEASAEAERAALDSKGEEATHTLYVRNIHDDVNEAQLRELFMPFGKLVKCSVVRHTSIKHRGYAFIQYMSKEEAAKAKEALTNKSISNQQIGIEYSYPKNRPFRGGGGGGGRIDDAPHGGGRGGRGRGGYGGGGGYDRGGRFDRRDDYDDGYDRRDRHDRRDPYEDDYEYVCV